MLFRFSHCSTSPAIQGLLPYHRRYRMRWNTVKWLCLISDIFYTTAAISTVGLKIALRRIRYDGWYGKGPWLKVGYVNVYTGKTYDYLNEAVGAADGHIMSQNRAPRKRGSCLLVKNLLWLQKNNYYIIYWKFNIQRFFVPIIWNYNIY